MDTGYGLSSKTAFSVRSTTAHLWKAGRFINDINIKRISGETARSTAPVLYYPVSAHDSQNMDKLYESASELILPRVCAWILMSEVSLTGRLMQKRCLRFLVSARTIFLVSPPSILANAYAVPVGRANSDIRTAVMKPVRPGDIYAIADILKSALQVTSFEVVTQSEGTFPQRIALMNHQ